MTDIWPTDCPHCTWIAAWSTLEAAALDSVWHLRYEHPELFIDWHEQSWQCLDAGPLPADVGERREIPPHYQ